MEEFAEGGRLSPLKVKEFIPAGTLGIGIDENVWIRKARTDGKTYWAEFLETWNYSKITPDYYNLNNGIRFKSNPRVEDKYGYEIFYDYVRGFKLVIFDADTLKDVETFTTENPQEFRDICIAVRDKNYEIVNASLRYEFTEIVGKLTSAFDKGELRKNFSQETQETPETKESKSKFEIGDYVKVVNDLQQVMNAYSQQEKYKFDNPNETVNVENGTEGYVVGIYYETEYNENRIVVKKLDNFGTIYEEFIIAEQGLELVSKALKVGDTVYVKDVNYLYSTAPKLKTELGFKDPNSITKGSEVSYTTGEVFVVGQSTQNLMPVYGVNIKNLDEEILIGVQGLELIPTSKDNLQNTKIQINNPEENKIIQEYAFSLGYFWLGVERNIIQYFDDYPAYMEFTSDGQIFAPTKKQFDREYKKQVTLEELGLVSSKPTQPQTEFVCNVDISKINSPYVGAFYSKNKDRIEKLKSEFSCKILESLVYLSDYENCGGGVQLPIQEVIEEDDLLGAIRNLK